eukprot:1323589-Rhodomonas_salina.4
MEWQVPEEMGIRTWFSGFASDGCRARLRSCPLNVSTGPGHSIAHTRMARAAELTCRGHFPRNAAAQTLRKGFQRLRHGTQCTSRTLRRDCT